MDSPTRDGAGSRLPRLLVALLGLFLIGLAGLSATSSRPAAHAQRDIVVAAAGDAAVMVRTSTHRLTAAARPSADRLVPPSGTLPAAVLVAFLLALRVRRSRGEALAGQPQALVIAGRGPPVRF